MLDDESMRLQPCGAGRIRHTVEVGGELSPVVGRFWLAVPLCLIAGYMPLHAQNTNDLNGGVQFEFAQPAGARSQGIGGAFVAVADDATTAHDNPAGLTTFRRPEASVEVRHWQWKSTFPNSGHAFGLATGLGIDTVTGLVNGVTSSDATSLSFVSVVYPLRRWSFGGFRRQLLKYRMEREPQGAFFSCVGGSRGDNGTPPFCEPHAVFDGVDRLFPAKQAIRVDISSIGGSFAFQVNEALSVGGGGEFAMFEIEGSNEVFNARFEKKFMAPDWNTNQNLEHSTTERGNENSWTWNAGVLWRANDHWSVGAAMHRGPRFAFLTNTVRRDGTPIIPNRTDKFKVPDHYSAGTAFRTNPNAQNNFWLMSIQYERVNFSQIMEDFRASEEAWRTNPEEIVTVERLTLEDIQRIRGGLEFVTLVADASVAFRGGLTYDPQHQLYFRPDDVRTGLPDPRAALYFPRGQDDMHIAVGLGVAFRRFQVDAAADVADTRNTFVVSTVWGFR